MNQFHRNTETHSWIQYCRTWRNAEKHREAQAHNATLGLVPVIWLLANLNSTPRQEASNLEFMYQAFDTMNYMLAHRTFGSEDLNGNCFVDVSACFSPGCICGS
jgi:hypothetical protein